MSASLWGRVRQRAGNQCEYCRMPAKFDPLPFEVDHIESQQHGGKTIFGNLALACFPCNHRKGPNLAGRDPVTGRLTRLFHPRRDAWSRHFLWNGALLIGRTAIGRTTIEVLGINLPHRVSHRQALIEEGVFPAEAKKA